MVTAPPVLLVTFGAPKVQVSVRIPSTIFIVGGQDTVKVNGEELQAPLHRKNMPVIDIKNLLMLASF